MKSERLLFIGSKKQGFEVLKCIAEVIPDILVGCVSIDDTSDSRSVYDRFQGYCQNKNYPLITLSGKCDLTETIEKYQPDLCLVVGWYYFISKTVRDMVKYGFIGVHNSLLPSYRGLAPVVWAIINGERETGFSVFSLDDGIDNGKLWYQEKVAIYDDDYVENIILRIEERVVDFFRKSILDLVEGRIEAKNQSDKDISYGAKRSEKDGHIEWCWNAKKIFNFVRAQSHPYPGAYTYYQENMYKIWSIDVFPFVVYGIPGQPIIIEKDRGSVVVCCGENTAVRINKMDMGTEQVPAYQIVSSLKDRLY